VGSSGSIGRLRRASGALGLPPAARVAALRTPPSLPLALAAPLAPSVQRRFQLSASFPGRGAVRVSVACYECA